MNDEQRSPRWLRARVPLLLACLGWACTAPTLVADADIHELVSRCLDSPGAPAYVLPLSRAGLALAVVAVCWGSRQLVTGVRSRTLRLSLGHALLCAVLPVAVIGVPVQYALTQTAAHDTGPRPSPCIGHGPLGATPVAAGERPAATG
ncbi:hypothetical protein ACIBCA_20815 [Kitasatospora sp. NPDC051170]|uniref:hypothetical protein n=1 Tax=Kitasatospora sp. NPDC051170 TaxID=3364056 RepID=UPI003794552A